MTDFFDINRFGRLLRAHWAESWREYAWFAGALVMLDLIAIAISFSTESSHVFWPFQYKGQATWYMTGLSLSAVIFAGRYFKYLLNPGASLIALMRPASVFEKWLMAFLVISIFYPLVYSMIYTLLNYPAVQVAKALATQAADCKGCSTDFRFYFPLLTSDLTENPLVSQLFSFICLSSAQALIAGGTVYFKRSPVLRTVFGAFLLFVISAWIGSTPQSGTFIRQYGEDMMPYGTTEYVLSWGLWLGLPVLLWTALFFHIKEREVA